MKNYQSEAFAFGCEVDELARQLVRDGIAAPWDAIQIARDRVQRQRQEAARARTRDEAMGRLCSRLGGSGA